MTLAVKSKDKAVILMCSAMLLMTSCGRPVAYTNHRLAKEKEAAEEYLRSEYPEEEFTVTAANERTVEHGIWNYDIAVYGIDQDSRVYVVSHDNDWDVKEYLWKCYNCTKPFNMGYESCPYCESENTWHKYHPKLWEESSAESTAR